MARCDSQPARQAGVQAECHTTNGVSILVRGLNTATFEGLPGRSRVIGDAMTASLSTHQAAQDSSRHDHRALQRAGLRPLVPAKLPLHLVEPEGQLQIHTASYRGSFSSVLSQAVRSAGLGSRVVIAQFLKGGVNQGPDGQVQLCGGLSWLRPAVPACVSEPGQPQDGGGC